MTSSEPLREWKKLESFTLFATAQGTSSSYVSILSGIIGWDDLITLYFFTRILTGTGAYGG